MEAKKRNDTFLLFLLLPLIINFSNFQQKEPDPYRGVKMSLLHDLAESASYPRDIENEPAFSNQFHFNHLNYGDVFDTYRGDGVTVAVIDDGIQYNHPDFTDNNMRSLSLLSASIEDVGEEFIEIEIKKAADFGYMVVNQYSGERHGTNVAATIAALVNGKGTAGVSPNVDLMFLKPVNLYITEMCAAIEYAVDNGADIINISLGIYEDSFTDGFGEHHEGVSGISTYIQNYVDYAYEHDVTIVSSAGNANTDYPNYPAANQHVIGVGALARDSSTIRASYSNYGGDNVDLVAPGSVYVASPTNTYTETQGTSFSSPIVAAAAALMKQQVPSASPDQIATKLKATAFDLGATGHDDYFGAGRLDIGALMAEVAVSGVSISPENIIIRAGENAQVQATISPYDATNKSVSFFSENTAIASVDATTGLVTGINEGHTRIGVTTDDGAFQSFTNIEVITEHAVMPITNIEVDETTLTIGIDETYQLNVALVPQNALLSDVSFTSDDEAVATVSDQGMITGVSPGEARVSVRAKSGTASDEVLVTVEPYQIVTDTSTFTSWNFTADPVDWIGGYGTGFSSAAGVEITSFSSGTNTNSPYYYHDVVGVRVGYTTSPTVKGSLQVSFKEDPSRISGSVVQENPLDGTANFQRREMLFTPTTVDDGYVNVMGIIESGTLYIKDVAIIYKQYVSIIPVSGVMFSETSRTLNIGETYQLTYSVDPIDASDQSVEFSSDDESIVSVTSTGLVSAIGAGVSQVHITTLDGGFSDTITLTVIRQATHEKSLTLDVDLFQQTYSFKQALDLEHLFASYQNEYGEITQLTGEDLTLEGGSTAQLGSSTLTFSYQGVLAYTSISITNVGAVDRMGDTVIFTGEEQANAYEAYFMFVTGLECADRLVNPSTWNHLEVEFNAMIDDAKSRLISGYYPQLQARYQVILEAYHLNDYIYGTNAQAAGRVYLEGWDRSTIIFAATAMLSCLSLAILTIYLRKKIH